MSDFQLKLELRIDWSEIDLFGHVNNVAISKYVQAARVHCLEVLGLMQSKAETEIGPILASTSCQFREPLFYPGHVTIYTKVDEIKNTSFRIQHLIHNDQEAIAAEAQDIIVFYDFGKKTKLKLPDELRKKIEALG